jgi:hypothetical protein
MSIKKLVVGSGKHYVYAHRDPSTGETLYIGCGSTDRAWRWHKGGRTEPHHRVLKSYIDEGHKMEHIVTIIDYNLTHDEASAMEVTLIARHKPVFNHLLNPDMPGITSGERNGQAKIDEGTVVAIRERYADGGVTMKELASTYGISQSQAHRIIRGDTWKTTQAVH